MIRKHYNLAMFTFILLAAMLLGAQASLAQEELAGICIADPGENIDQKIKKLGLGAYYDLHPDAPGDIFIMAPSSGEKRVEVFGLKTAEDGSMHLADLKEVIGPAKYQAVYLLRHPVSKDRPDLAVCYTGNDRLRQCWVPRYNKENGALILDPGFFPLRTTSKIDQARRYERAGKPFLTGSELIDQPHFMVHRLESREQLAALASQFKITPKGEFKDGLPHKFLFMPITVPATLMLAVEEDQGGNVVRTKDLAEITLQDGEAAVFSLNLHDLGADNYYTFGSCVDADISFYWWSPSINQQTGDLEGHGLSLLDKFIPWSFN
ncbi:hypothetical protein LJC36_00900 [Desulfovibrio sp. OttesenSCG-928-C14]|nr:hypothetical protein [Desulfovibrio sp. OttesenSCG-928-C14]